MTPLLAADALSCRFPGPAPGLLARLRRTPPVQVHAVSDVTLHVGAHEALGLVGESGCGKSTLSRMMAGILPPSGGDVLWHGQRIAVHVAPHGPGPGVDTAADLARVRAIFAATAAGLPSP